MNPPWKTRKKYYWSVIYFLLGSGIPLILFLTEFRIQPSFYDNVAPGSLAEFIPDVVKVYSPLFIYAILVGFLLPLYIIPAYEFFRHAIPDPRINRVRKNLVIAAIAVAVIVTIADFCGGDAAIWEVKPPEHIPFVAHFVNADVATGMEAKKQYKAGIESVLNQGMSHWSFTRYAYLFSILIEAFFLNLFFYICFLYYAFRRALKNQDEMTFYKIANGLIISSMLIFIWLLLRTMNGIEKRNLYPDFALQVADVAVGILNIFCLFAVVLARLSNKKIRKAAEEVLSLLAAGGFTIASVWAYINKSVLVEYLGKKAGLWSYLVFPIVFLLLWMAYYLVNLGSEFNQQYNVPKRSDDL